jgi:hypothetical protein
MFEDDVYRGLSASPGAWKPFLEAEKKYIGIFLSINGKIGTFYL